ncbi:MAG: arsenate reductase [Ferrimonas sp.]
MLTIYGIKNCDSVKKARKYFERQGTEYQFYDFREQGITEELLIQWLQQVPFRTLLNTRSTSWRNLSDCDKADLTEDKAKTLMLANPTLIKRPVIITNGQMTVGFNSKDGIKV